MLGMLLPEAYGQQARVSGWYSIQSAASTDFTQQVERLVTTVLRRRFDGLPFTPTQRDGLYRLLASHGPDDLIFISGTAADVRSLVSDDRLGIVGKLNLELINVRVGAAPFFLFTRSDQVRRIRDQSAAPPRVVYASRAGALQQNDVQLLLSKVLATKPVVAPPLNSPDELARRLLTDASIVGIYDTDPSPFLHEFLSAYQRQRMGGTAGSDTQLIQVLMSPSGLPDPQQGSLQPLQGNLTFAVVRFDDVAVENLPGVGPARKEPMLAVSSGTGTAGTDAFWVLSNVRRVAGDPEYLRTRQLLGNAYYAALFDRQDFMARCKGGSAAQYTPYLLDAHLGDRQSLPKGLALWSDLILRSGAGRPADAAAIRDQLTLVEALLKERLNVQMTTTAGRTAVTDKLRGPRGTVRQQFSDASGTLFEQAVGDVRAALNIKDAAGRTSRFNAARAKLLALIEKGDGPACKGRDLGLFGRGLDPYFYLSLVDAYLALDTAVAAR